MSAPPPQLQLVLNAIGRAPLATHTDITALLSACVSRIEQAERELPLLDLGKVIDHLSSAEGALEEVFAIDPAEHARLRAEYDHEQSCKERLELRGVTR